MARALVLVVASVMAGMAAISCATKEVQPPPIWTPKPPVPIVTPIMPTSAASTDAEACAPNAPSVEPAEPDPEAARAFLEGFSERSAPLAEAGDPPRVLSMGLESSRFAEAATLTPDGPPRSATLAEGERASMPVSIAAKGCVTYIAQGGLGASIVDAFLTSADSSPPRIVAEGRGSGSIAVIGGRAGCVASPSPAAPWSGELHVRMRRGSGLVLVQAYRR